MIKALALILCAFGGVTAARAAPDCGTMARISLAGVALSNMAAERIAAAAPGTVRPQPGAPPLDVALPAYCRVIGTIGARTGSDGKAYGLRFALALPDGWNGRFLFQGGGGLNGTVNPPLGASAAGRVPALARGFAVVSTDSGHAGAVFDRGFMDDQRALLDFAQDSVGTVTPVAKQLVAAYYGRPADHAYFSGCSTGGREGMLAAERYPEMFDGIVVGAPAMRTGNSNLALTHAAVAFNQASARDAAGMPLAESLFSATDKTLIITALLDACDGLDGLKDGVIANVAACRFHPATLQCAPGRTEGCLSPAQVRALDTAFAAPRDATGAPLYADYPYDTGIVAEGGGIPGFLPNAGKSPLGPRTQSLTFDADAMIARVRADAGQGLTDTDRWTNLGAFTGHGGRILFYHGWSDPWFSPLDTLDYYRRAEAANGGPEAWAKVSRFYPVPGMGHCRGGANTFDTFDLLGAVVEWVEQGRAPDAVAASHMLPTPASRPLCPLPSYPAYIGGDATKAASFACRMPARE